METAPASTLLQLALNPSLGIPIYRQIMDAVREQIAAGILKPGDRLPSIRELSAHLRITPASAVKAYSELRHAGIITLDQGRGTFVNENSSVVTESRDDLIARDLEGLLQRSRALGVSDEQVVAALKRLIEDGRPHPSKAHGKRRGA